MCLFLKRAMSDQTILHNLAFVKNYAASRKWNKVDKLGPSLHTLYRTSRKSHKKCSSVDNGSRNLLNDFSITCPPQNVCNDTFTVAIRTFNQTFLISSICLCFSKKVKPRFCVTAFRNLCKNSTEVG